LQQQQTPSEQEGGSESAREWKKPSEPSREGEGGEKRQRSGEQKPEGGESRQRGRRPEDYFDALRDVFGIVKSDIIPEGGKRGRHAWGRGGERTSPTQKLPEIFRRVEETLKQAGAEPLGAERGIRDVESLILPWSKLLEVGLYESGYGPDYRKTYIRPSPLVAPVGLAGGGSIEEILARSMPLPGRRYLAPRPVLALVDTSGSISESELKRFVSELYSLLRRYNVPAVHVIFWDAEAYGPYVASTPQQLVEIARRHIKGGGGTVIAPALRKALEILRRFEEPPMLLIYTDSVIFDINVPETRRLFEKIAGKVPVKLFFTTYTEPPEWLRKLGFKVSRIGLSSAVK